MASIKSNSSNGSGPFRNFLTLVVAFASVACLSGGMALAFAGQYFSGEQLWVLIGFLVVFPFVGIAVISWLVLRHARKLTASESNNEIKWKLISAEKQKTNLNREVNQLSAILKVPKAQLSDLRSAYIVAEDLALRKIQEESQCPVLRYVNIGGADFNGVYVDGDLITCIQITFVVSPDIRQEKINAILKKTSSAKAEITSLQKGARTRLLLVLVTQLDIEAEAQLRSSLVSKFATTPVDVDIRLLDFQGLQKVYSES